MNSQRGAGCRRATGGRAADRAKRTLDVVCGGAALVAAAPALALVGVVVRAFMGRPVLFRQRRSGRGGVSFELHKFRTMRLADPGRDGPEFDDERLTTLGRSLRRWSLDELPSLWNVVRGDLSLVGPRPLPVRYETRYDPRQRTRLDVRPGITGWAQVNGRNATSWAERLELDAWYVENRSLRLDVEILLRTVVQVLRRQGVSHDGHATMPEFTGTAPSM